MQAVTWTHKEGLPPNIPQKREDQGSECHTTLYLGEQEGHLGSIFNFYGSNYWEMGQGNGWNGH